MKKNSFLLTNELGRVLIGKESDIRMINVRKMLVVLVALLLMLSTLNSIIPVSAGSSVIHVYEGQSIQAAINAASEGGKIIVHAGTYYQSLSINKVLTLLGKDAIIDLAGTEFKTAIFVNTGRVTISGFTIKNIPAEVHAGAIHYPVPGMGVSGGLIENNIIYSGFYGIILNGPSSIEIRNNWITAVNPISLIGAPDAVLKNNVLSAHKLEGEPEWLGQGITLHSSSGLIEGNIINSEYWGINLNSPSNIEVRNNKICTSYYGGF